MALLTGCFLALLQVNAHAQVTVSAPTVPLLDAPSDKADVVGMVTQGHVLKATGRREGDWLEVKAPDAVSGWVYAELVRNGMVEASSVRLRSGAGIGYHSLGTLTKGTPVVVRGRKGDWLEISVPPSFRVWVERALVGEHAVLDLTVHQPSPVSEPTPVQEESASSPPVPRSLARPVTEPSPADVPATPSLPVSRDTVSAVPSTTETATKPMASGIRSSRPRPASSAVPRPRDSRRHPPRLPVEVASPEPDQGLASLRLIGSAPQGQSVAVSGVLRPVGPNVFCPAGFRLVSATPPSRTICYLHGHSQHLETHVGNYVSLTGKQYWVLGSREPLVSVRTIQP